MTKAEKKMMVKKNSLGIRVARAFLKTLLLLLLLFVVLLVSLNVYLASNETKIISNIALLNDGSVKFKSAKIRVFRDFPKATITVTDFSVRDAQFDSHQQPILAVKKLVLTASLKDIRSRQVRLNSFELWDGNISIFKDKDGYSNLKSLIRKETEEENEEAYLQFLTDDMEFDFHNVILNYTDNLKTTAIHGTLNAFTAKVQKKSNGLACNVNMAVHMDEMTFKREKGSFLKDSQLAGKMDLDIVNGNITFQPFDLNINEEVFTFSGNYDPTKKTKTTLVLENEETAWAQTIPLLADSLQEKLKIYNISQPFYSKTTISSFFKPDESLLVHVEFRMDEENQVKVKKFQFYEVILTGQYINRQFDGMQGLAEDGKHHRILLEKLSAKYEDFNFHAPKALITVNSPGNPYIATNIMVDGPPASISKFLKNQKFLFKRGSFNLQAKVEGPLKNFSQLALDSEAGLTLRNFSVIYKPSNTAFPFRKLELYKKRGDADFSIVSSSFKNGNDFQIDGGVQNMNALLFSMYGQASSDVNFVADKLGWADFVNIFGENGYLDDGKNNKDDFGKKKSMKETLRGIHYQFQPKISVAVDTLQYFDQLELHRFKTGIHFADSNTIILENTSFNYGKGSVNLHGSLDIREPGYTPFKVELHAKRLNLATLLPPFDHFGIKLLADMDDLPEDMDIDLVHKGILDDETGLIPHTSTGEIIFNLDNGETLLGKIQYAPGASDAKVVNNKKVMGGSLKTRLILEGDPVLFNEFLKNDRFFFSNGRFNTQFDYDGDITDFRDLLSHSNAAFNLENSDVYYKQGNVSFPLTNIKLLLKNDNADFDAFMKSEKVQQEIRLVGNIENLSEVVIGKTGKQVKTNVSITSPSIKWSEFLGLFTARNQDSTKLLTLKQTTRGIMDAFSPNVFVHLDTFVYSDKLMLHAVQTGITMVDSTTLRLEETGFRFNEGKVRLNGTVNLGIEHATPFEAHFNADSLDIAKLLESLDYLDIPSFENIEKLSGQTNLTLDWEGVIKEGGKNVQSKDNKGQLNFELHNIVIKGFQPLDELAAKIGMKKRFAEISFAPIKNNLTIRGSDIDIPLMEIQSNAINMFIEGVYSYGTNTNIWITIPFNNFKAANRAIIPPKRGYETAKAKIFLEVTTDEHNNNKFKFHLRKKKFYKQRGITEQYRKDLKKNRQLRKAQKKGN